jgi:thioredoxin-related protein
MLASGYLETPKLEPILIFTLENAYRNSNYDDFRAGFEKAYHDSITAVQSKAMNWQTPKTFFNGDSVKTKKTIILIEADWCNSCKVMKTATFTDSSITKFISEKYNLVEINPDLRDTLIFHGKAFTGQANQTPYHSLAFELTRGSFAFPSAIFLNENMEVIDVVNSYINPKFMDQISHFYGDDAYKTKSWKDFSAAYGK